MSNIEEMDALLRGHGVDPTEIVATEPITEKMIALSRGWDAVDAGITKNELPASCTQNPGFMTGYDDATATINISLIARAVIPHHAYADFDDPDLFTEFQRGLSRDTLAALAAALQSKNSLRRRSACKPGAFRTVTDTV
jgi:hypothetical protein